MAKQSVTPTTAWVANSTNPYADQAYMAGTRPEVAAVLLYNLTFTGEVPNNQGIGNATAGGGYIALTATPTSTGINNTNIFYSSITDDPLFVGGADGLRDTYHADSALYSFANQTLFINHPTTQKFYMRMRVKWSSNWEWGNDQLKFCKNKGPGTLTTNCPKFQGSEIVITKLFGPTDAYDQTVYAENPSPSFSERVDDIVNDFGGAGVDANWSPVLNQWYWIEWEIDAGTPAISDGSFRIWIDGNLYMSLDNTVVQKLGDVGFDYHELGHVWQNGYPTVDISMYYHALEIYDKRPASLPVGIA